MKTGKPFLNEASNAKAEAIGASLATPRVWKRNPIWLINMQTRTALQRGQAGRLFATKG